MPDSLSPNRGTHYKICVCVLAHNEETHIERTIKSLLIQSAIDDCKIHVYANGCTDRTIDIVNNISESHSNIYLTAIDIASKTNAWNVAFNENHYEYLVFTDGDIIVPDDGVEILIRNLNENSIYIVASSKQLPYFKNSNLEQKIVGFMQLPLRHDYLCGAFYAIRRSEIKNEFYNQGFDGLPLGLVGEDRFIQLLVGDSKIIYANCYSLYEPPDLNDYCRYLARIKWQNEQLQLYFTHDVTHKITFVKFINKIVCYDNIKLLCISIFSVCFRFSFKLLYKNKINKIYNQLGNISKAASPILQDLTRSKSVK